MSDTVSERTVRLRIEGMTCGSCVARIETALRGAPSVRDVIVNLATETAEAGEAVGFASALEFLESLELRLETHQRDPRRAAGHAFGGVDRRSGIQPRQVEPHERSRIGPVPPAELAGAPAHHQGRPALRGFGEAGGHLFGAAGSVEAIACALAMEKQIIPPTINYDTPDPDLDINVITEPTPADLKVVMNNSFGFGGHNAVMVMKKYEG